MDTEGMLVRRAEQYRRILKQSPGLLAAAEAALRPGYRSGDRVAALDGSCVFGPALIGFVLWLLRDAAALGKTRLYFLARDGYLMHQAAQIFCRRLGLPIECRYLSCSRYSLRLPEYHLDHEAALRHICRGGLEVSLRRVLSRAGLTDEEQRITADHLGLLPGMDRPLGAGELSRLRQRLAACPVFLRYMDDRSEAAYPLLCGYLKQEGLLNGTADALVDSGWVGTVQQSLGRILARMGRRYPPEGYYWGLYDLPPDACGRDYHFYAFGPRGPAAAKALFSNCLFEAVFTAPHGMTVGYREQGGKFLPCYGAVSEMRADLLKGLSDGILETVRMYAEHMGASLPDLRALKQLRSTAGRLLTLLMKFPSYPEAELLGELPFSDDMTGEESRLAAPLSERELEQCRSPYRLLDRRGAVGQSGWYEGSAVRYSNRPRRHIYWYTLYRYCLYSGMQLRNRLGRANGREESIPKRSG